MLAAGTAAALVPIRSITKRDSNRLAGQARVSSNNDAETVTYIPEGIEEPGEICTKLLEQLKGIQLGKIEDKFGWRFEVTEQDGKSVVGESDSGGAADADSVDQLD